jgi:hypothetical protein
VVVIVARGQEGRVESDLPTVGDQTESERVAIEAERSIEVCNPKVHVADADGGMDGFVVHGLQSAARCPVRRR